MDEETSAQNGPDPAVDLTSCEREPIHIPGAILPHGAMLVLESNTLIVTQAAGATQELLGRSIEELLGSRVETLFNASQIARLRQIAGQADLSKPRHLLDPALRVDADRPLDASVHKSDGLLVLEFEAADSADRDSADPLSRVHEMLDDLDSSSSMQACCQEAAERVRRLTGYDRVMIYRFADDGSGWVFAESLRDGLPPFLDLHYPASDIPQQARALYLKNPLRLITQVDYKPAPLIPALNPHTGKPLDMSQATLRDVSPIHREYLRNMGVDASMSISIIRGGKLWGLFSCHHYTPRRLPRPIRAICELFGAMFALHLEARDRTSQFEARLASRQILQQLMHNLAAEEDYAQGLINNSPNLLDYIDAGGLSLRFENAGGVAIRLNDGITALGITPSPEQIAALTDWLAIQMKGGDGLFVTDRLSEIWPPGADFAPVGSGLLAITVSREPSNFIIWFRPEVIETVRWGGDPTKPVEFGPEGARLSPRKSFDAWSETVRGRSNAWLPTDADAALDLRLALLEVVLRRIDAVARERERVHAQERLLMAELDHRVKNTLANISALVMQTSKNADSLSGFATGLNRRIQSMARAHSLLTLSRWDGVSVASLLQEELDHYGQGGATIAIDGPEVVLSPKAALALSLALHELTTNAAKYGALSVPGGRVSVRWHLLADGTVRLRWQEAGGPRVSPPTRRGFGTTLIERALAMETGGQSSLQYRPEGLSCAIELPPAAVIRVTSERSEAAPVANPEPTLGAALPVQGRRRILVVEDSSLVVMTLEHLLDELGWEMVGPATRVAQALELARSAGADAALLDINLDGEVSWEIAHVLKERGIPFAFTTGYEAGMVLPPEFSDYPVINKPFRSEDIQQRLRGMATPQP